MRNILNRFSPQDMIELRMILFGTVVSTLGGFMFGLGLLANAASVDATLDGYLTQFVLAAILGGGVGFVYGYIASLVLGFMIAALTLVFFREMRYPLLFRAVAGIVTAVGIYLFSPLNVIPWSLSTVLKNDVSRSPVAAAVLVLYLVAIYLSQIVARKYICEVSSFGRKAKPR